MAKFVETYSAQKSNLRSDQKGTNRLMHAHSKDRRGNLVPVMAAAVIAVVGTAALFFMDFGPNNEVKRNGISMITTAVVDRAGATALPTEPAAHAAAPAP